MSASSHVFISPPEYSLLAAQLWSLRALLVVDRPLILLLVPARLQSLIAFDGSVLSHRDIHLCHALTRLLVCNYAVGSTSRLLVLARALVRTDLMHSYD